MNVVLLCGSHPRHLHLAGALAEQGLLRGLVVEQREAMVPTAGPHLTARDQALFDEHFRRREAAEMAAFDPHRPDAFGVPVHPVQRTELNDPATLAFVTGLDDVDVLLSYGVHKIDDAVLEGVRARSISAWNIHGGLSPWYRGTATLFWPFYFLQPNWAGMTLHELTAQIDGGDVLHQSRPPLKRGDGIHDVGTRAVLEIAKDVVELLVEDRPEEIQRAPQRTAGRIFRDADWHPAMLRMVYEVYEDRIVDAWLDGELSTSEPSVHRWRS